MRKLKDEQINILKWNFILTSSCTIGQSHSAISVAWLPPSNSYLIKVFCQESWGYNRNHVYHCCLQGSSCLGQDRACTHGPLESSVRWGCKVCSAYYESSQQKNNTADNSRWKVLQENKGCQDGPRMSLASKKEKKHHG